MTPKTTRILTGLTATLILALAIANASANRLSITSSRLWRVTWTSLKLRNNINSNTMLCPLTLEGSFHHATIVKTLNSLVGYVKRATTNSAACTGGHWTVPQESLPWHIRYRGYSGRLPNITLIILGIVGVRWEIETAGLTCIATTTASSPFLGRLSVNSSGVVTELNPEPNARIPLEGGLCGLATGTFEEPSQTLTEEGGTARITVTLI